MDQAKLRNRIAVLEEIEREVHRAKGGLLAEHHEMVSDAMLIVRHKAGWLWQQMLAKKKTT